MNDNQSPDQADGAPVTTERSSTPTVSTKPVEPMIVTGGDKDPSIVTPDGKILPIPQPPTPTKGT